MKAAHRPKIFDGLVKFRVEPGLDAAIDLAARRECTTTSEYLRRAVREKLRADGVSLPQADGLPGRRVA